MADFEDTFSGTLDIIEDYSDNRHPHSPLSRTIQECMPNVNMELIHQNTRKLY